MRALCLAVTTARVIGGFPRPAMAQNQEKPRWTTRSVGEWVERLKNPRPEERQEAAHSLGQIGPSARSSVPALAQALQDEGIGVRQNAAHARAIHGPFAGDIVPVLVRTLSDPDPEVRRQIALALGRCGPAAKEGVPALAKALTDQETGVRTAAAWALGKVGPEARAALPALAKALYDPAESVLVAAAGSLGRLGPEAKAAVPSLLDALHEESPAVVAQVHLALWKVARRQANLNALMQGLFERRSNERLFYAQALANAGPGAKYAVPPLAQALGDSDPAVRTAAAWAFGDIGPEARPFVPVLDDALKKARGEEKPALHYALWKLAKRPRDLQGLIAGLEEKNPQALLAVIRALGRLGPEAQPAATALLRRLDDGAFSQERDGRAMLCAADCHEALGNWTKAEELVQAVSERYDNQWLDWFAWCRRTDHGDVAAARQFASRAAATQGTVQGLDCSGIFHLLDGQAGEAVAAFQRSERLKKGQETILCLLGLAADAAGRREDRDAAWQELASKPTALGVLARHFRNALAKGEKEIPDLEEVKALLNLLQGRDLNDAHLYVGEFLRMRGRPKESLVHLRACWHGEGGHPYLRALAGYRVHEMKEKP